MPLFSVVIPTYNRAGPVRAALSSVLGQTFADFEVLVMDDGSTDATHAVIESFGDQRVRYAWAENSGGPAAPRNRGIEAATGEWIAFLDSDDAWHANKLEVVAQAIGQHPRAHAISHDERVLDPDGRPTGRRLAHGPYEPAFYRAMLIEGNRCSPSAMTLRASFLRANALRFDERPDHIVVEDYDFWLRFARVGGEVLFLTQALSDYLLQPDSISQNQERYLANLETVLRDHVFQIQAFEPDRERLWKSVALRLHVARIKQFAARGQLGAAAQLALRTFASTPAGSAAYALSRFRARRRSMAQ